MQALTPAEVAMPNREMTSEQYALQIIGFLLSYPDVAWREQLSAVADGIKDIADARTRQACEAVLQHINSLTVRDYEDEYVRAFDFSGNTNMYLASYDCSNAGEQSEKLLAYKGFFEDNGFTLSKELPDYVPALLELCAAVSPAIAADILAYAEEALSLFKKRLTDSGYVQAQLVDCILSSRRRLEGRTL